VLTDHYLNKILKRLIVKPIKFTEFAPFIQNYSLPQVCILLICVDHHQG